MAIVINVIESGKQSVYGIPDYINVSITGVSNVIVYYTTDGTTPDTTGFSLSTLIMEHAVGDPLNGVIFLSADDNILHLNILAVSESPYQASTFYRRYGYSERIKDINDLPESAYTYSFSANTAADGTIIAADGYTEGSAEKVIHTQDGADGYVDKFSIATSGFETAIPERVYDHIDGYDADGNPITTRLSNVQEDKLTKKSNRGHVFISTADGMKAVLKPIQIDPRSTTIKDSRGDYIEVVPEEHYPINDYTKDGYAIDVNYDEDAPKPREFFSTSGLFDPNASYIEIDARIDGYINGEKIRPGDRVIINKPFGDIRYPIKKQDFGRAYLDNHVISGGISSPIFDYNRGQAVFYYWDARDNRVVKSIQKITTPNYGPPASRVGPAGLVYKWITGKKQVMPG